MQAAVSGRGLWEDSQPACTKTRKNNFFSNIMNPYIKKQLEALFLPAKIQKSITKSIGLKESRLIL